MFGLRDEWLRVWEDVRLICYDIIINCDIPLWTKMDCFARARNDEGGGGWMREVPSPRPSPGGGEGEGGAYLLSSFVINSIPPNVIGNIRSSTNCLTILIDIA